MSGEDQTQAPTPDPTNDADAHRATDPAAPAEVAAEAPPQDNTQTAQTAHVQQQPVQEIQHHRIGAGQGAGVRVTTLVGNVKRRHLGKSGDVQDTVSIPRESLERLLLAVNEGRDDEATSTLRSWIGAAEQAHSEPPPPAAAEGEVST